MSAVNTKKPIGTYLPPAKRVKAEKFDKGSEEYQRLQWDENKKKINGLINKANIANIKSIIEELFRCNLIRYKGLFATAILKAQEISPVYTDVYVAILAIVNSRFNMIGKLVIDRLILQYRLNFMNNNKSKCLASVKFIAHLINQDVVSETLGFQIIDHLIAQPTPASIEIVITFIKQCGKRLNDLNTTCLFEVLRTLRNLSLEKDLDTRTHEMIDSLHHIRRSEFKDYPTIKPELDLVDEEDKEENFTHSIELTDPKRTDFHMEFNYFKFDPKWDENEAKYENFKRSLLEEEESSDSGSGSESDTGSQDDDKKDTQGAIKREEDAPEVKPDVKPQVIDATQTDIVAFRRMIYLIIRSSVRHDEVVHKLLKAKIEPALHDELCQMILDCCGQERTYESIYGLVASKLCQIIRDFGPKFARIFELFYETAHKFEANKIRNVAKFYVHLLTTESIDWNCLACIKLTENDTTPAGRCFIANVFQELASVLSLSTLQEYINDPTKKDAFEGIFPSDEEEHMRYAILFFTNCGLGKLVEDLTKELLAKQDSK